MDDEKLRTLNRLIMDAIAEEIGAIIGDPLDLRWPPEVTLASICNCLAFLSRLSNENISNYAGIVASSHKGGSDEEVRKFQERWGVARPLPSHDDSRVLHVERVCQEALRIPHELYRRPVHLQMAAYCLMAGLLARYRGDEPSAVVDRVTATVPLSPV